MVSKVSALWALGVLSRDRFSGAYVRGEVGSVSPQPQTPSTQRMPPAHRRGGRATRAGLG